MRGKINNIKGKVFGRIAVIEFSHKDSNNKACWKCLCECGNEVILIGSDLISGNTKSCGCLKKDTVSARNTVHGLSNHPMYMVWLDMKQRVTNRNNTAYNHYGERGITICDKWMSFEGFYDDMHSSYEDGLTINRIDPNGNYCKENCAWATGSEQGHFKRKKKGCSSQYVGVSFNKKLLKFTAYISINEKREHLGCFFSEIEAAIAHDNRSEELYGDRPNKTKV